MKVKGDGSIIPLDGKGVPKSKCRNWELRVSVGRNLATGKYPPRTRRFKGTHTEARSAMRAFIAEIEAEDVPVTRKQGMTFGEYADAWVEERKATHARDTWEKNACHLKCLKMHLRAAKLDEVTPRVLDAIIDQLREGDSPSGRKLSETYLQDMTATGHRMYWQAMKDGHASSNPFDFVDTPSRDTEERPEVGIEGIEQLIAQLDPAEPSQLVALVALRMGLRREEVVRLDVEDVDFAANTLHVRHGVDRKGERKGTKTRKGKRDLPLGEGARRDFRRRLAAMEEEFARMREELGRSEPAMGPHTPLVCDALGKRMEPGAASRWWRRNRRRLGFEGCTLHDLRHSYLSEMARRDTPVRVLQELAGHEDYRTTEQIYVHVSMEDMRRAIEEAGSWG